MMQKLQLQACYRAILKKKVMYAIFGDEIICWITQIAGRYTLLIL